MQNDLQTNCEVAWAAGLFEGEGCIHVSTQGGGRWPRVVLTLGMTDRDVVERFARFADCGNINIRPSSKPEWNDFHVWSMGGRKARVVLETLLPWFGERRAAKAHEALIAISRIGTPNGEKTHCPQGHQYDEGNTYRARDGSRRCKACSNASSRRRRARARCS